MVYVDPLMACLPNRNWRWRQVSHLVADTRSELHVFATMLGLRRSWFQSGAALPHYDLTPGKRALAVRKGATELTSREMGERILAADKIRSMADDLAKDET